MKFAVGYQLAEEGEESFVDIVRDYQGHVAEVYFPWLGMASGRSPLTVRRGYVDWAAQERLEQDLRAFRAMGVRLDLLMNANCYGGRAISQHLESEVASVLERLGEVCGGVDTVTTTSAILSWVRAALTRSLIASRSRCGVTISWPLIVCTSALIFCPSSFGFVV